MKMKDNEPPSAEERPAPTITTSTPLISSRSLRAYLIIALDIFNSLIKLINRG
jgi:hypothetical protein